MSAEFATTDRVTPAATAAVAAGSTTVFGPGKPVNIKRIIMVLTAAQTSAGAAATFGVRNADDSSSVTLGSFTVPVAAVNSVLKADVAGVKAGVTIPDTWGQSQNQTIALGVINGYQTNLPGEVKVNVGQEFWVTIAAGGAGGTSQMYFEYQEEGNNQTRFNPTDMAVTLS